MKNKMQNSLRLLVSALLGVVLFAAARVEAKTLVVGFAQVGAESSWRTAETESIKAEATKRGVTLKFSDAQGKLFPLQQQQLEQSRRAYETGDSDLTVLLLAETESYVTSAKIVDLQQRVSAALFKLQRAAGGGGVADRIQAAQESTAASTQPTTGQAP